MKQFYDEIRDNQSSLTIEEEAILFKRISTGDTEAKDIIFNANVKFAAFFIKKYYTNRTDSNLTPHENDLIQTASIGLFQAIDTFDYTKGVKFTSYARWIIKKEVSEYLAANLTTIRTPVTHVEGNLYPTTFSYDAINIDDDEEGNTSKLSILSSHDEIYNDLDKEKSIKLILSSLSPIDRDIVYQHAVNKLTHADMVKYLKKVHKVDYSRETVRLIYHRTIGKLRKKFSKQEFINLFI